MEQEVIVKTEMNGELLVLYVDENGTREEGIITTIEGANLEAALQQGNFIIEEVGEQQIQQQEVLNEPTPSEDQNNSKWTDEEIRRLLIFYIDNKETFLNGNASKKQLWDIACKTMLIGKTSASCEMKLRNLKRNYSRLRIDQMKGKSVFIWPYYDLCHRAFQDDNYVNLLINVAFKPTEKTGNNKESPVKVTSESKSTEKKVDEKVEQMLNLYLKFKRSQVDTRKRNIWEKITHELGEDADYWHKRFLNYKQHYIAILEKRVNCGPQSVNWPYTHIFDQIFEKDSEFQKKYGEKDPEFQKKYGQKSQISNSKCDVNQSVRILSDTIINQSFEWGETEKTVLVKYYFDCFDEFQDPTIPNTFLWHEIGRLLDMKPDECKKKYEELRNAHISLFLSGSYDVCNRNPIAILFDNIIAKEVQIEFAKFWGKANELEEWSVEEVDGLVQFFYDKLEMFKDPVCHFVCWDLVSKHLGRTIKSCKAEWDDLTSLYKTILEDKKEDPDIEVDWRYIELFERIFDYGMDTKLLEGYDICLNTKNEEAKAKKVNFNLEEEFLEMDENEEDDKNTTKRSLGKGDEKSFKILEYYLKNKDKFSTKKKGLWDPLAKQIGISTEQCAHRFRNLKQVYTSYIQRELNKPEMPILWPYYQMCKKVFGYRQIKNKLKNANNHSDESDDWTPRDIKRVISHFAKNFNQIDSNVDNKDLWAECAKEINKSVNSCREKFLELRKSYRKVKNVMTNNPDCKVNWKYYKLFDEIYSGKVVTAMDVDSDDSMDGTKKVKEVSNEDEDYQCIIVLPEGQEIPTQEQMSELPNTQIIITDNSQVMPDPKKIANKGAWKVSEKRRLLEQYLKYVKSHKGKIINTKDMWREIAKEFPNKSHKACQYTFVRLKNNYKKRKEEKDYQKTKVCELLKEIGTIKTKFYRPHYNVPENVLKDPNLCENVEMFEWKVELALKYYLDNLEEFLLPNYSTEHVWKEFGKMICVPLRKLVKKINYLKNFYNSETNEVEGKKLPYGHLIKQILEKELSIRISMEAIPVPANNTEVADEVWSDDDVHNLLSWYLENLQRFKNPKYVKSYLWMEAAKAVGKSAVSCSQKMSEIRSQYSSMMKENPQVLESWKFANLCQQIYGTGTKRAPRKTVSEAVLNLEAGEVANDPLEIRNETSEATEARDETFEAGTVKTTTALTTEG